MNLRRGILLLILIALVTFNFLQGAGALNPEPGTGQDPIVTKSYVDSYLARAMGELKEQLAYLQGEVQQIKSRIDRLEAQLSEPVILTIGESFARCGEEVLPLAQAPYTKEGRTMLPFRFIGEVMGAEVTWDGATRQAIFQKGNRVVKLTIGFKEAVINGQPVQLDIPPELVNSTTMVPVRFVAEGLGADIEWVPAAKQVVIRP